MNGSVDRWINGLLDCWIDGEDKYAWLGAHSATSARNNPLIQKSINPAFMNVLS
jgi:hypothetical protein